MSGEIREGLRVGVEVHAAAVGLRLTGERGEAHKGTRGTFIEHIVFDLAAAEDLISRLGEAIGIVRAAQAAACPVPSSPAPADGSSAP